MLNLAFEKLNALESRHWPFKRLYAAYWAMGHIFFSQVASSIWHQRGTSSLSAAAFDESAVDTDSTESFDPFLLTVYSPVA